jgi:hypothetical protein
MQQSIVKFIALSYLYWPNDNYKRLLINNRHMFYQLSVNKTLSFINKRLRFYQLTVNKNTIFYDGRKPEAATAV